MKSSAMVPVSGQVVVKEVSGKAMYAYDSTGWRALEAGKALQAGATIKTAAESNVVLKNVKAANFIRVDAGKVLHLTVEPPLEEMNPVRLARVKEGGTQGEGENTERKKFALGHSPF